MMKRYSWIVNGIVLTMIAYFSADIASFFVELRLESAIESLHSPQNNSTATATKIATVLPNDPFIVEGNIFSSKLRWKEPEEEKPLLLPPPPQPIIQLPPPKPPLRLNLVGTVMGDTNTPSYAVIEDPKTREHTLYQEGDFWTEDAQIIEVKRNQVTLLQDETRFVFLIALSPQDMPDRPQSIFMPTPPPPSMAPVLSLPPAGGVPGGIRQMSANQWLIDRTTVDRTLENLPMLLTQARVIPNFTDGKANGFRIFSIQPDSFYKQIGLQDGDILQSINGIEVKDPQNFLQVLDGLKRENRIALNFLRNNKDETSTYDIR